MSKEDFEVILVEDDLMTAESTTRWLESVLGVTVRYAFDIEGAKQLIDEHLPDLLLCDNGLPDGRGIEFLAEVKADNPGLSCILWSGYVSQEDRANACCLDGIYEKGMSGIANVGQHIHRIKDEKGKI